MNDISVFLGNLIYKVYIGCSNSRSTKKTLLFSLYRVFTKYSYYSDEDIILGFKYLLFISSIQQGFYKKWYDRSAPTKSMNTILEDISHSKNILYNFLNINENFNYTDICNYGDGEWYRFMSTKEKIYTREEVYDDLSNRLESIDFYLKHKQLDFESASKIQKAFRNFKDRKSKVKTDLKVLLELYRFRDPIGWPSACMGSLVNEGYALVCIKPNEDDSEKNNPFINHSFIIVNGRWYELVFSKESEPTINILATSHYLINHSNKDKTSYYKYKNRESSYPLRSKIMYKSEQELKQSISKLNHMYDKYNAIYVLEKTCSAYIGTAIDKEVQDFKDKRLTYGYHYNCHSFIFNVLKRAVSYAKQS